MCEKCIEHVKCPVGEKRVLPVAAREGGNTIDAYGRRLYWGPWEMVVDKYPDHTEAFIGQRVWDENNVQYGSGFDITHCPFCGEKLV